MTTIATDGKTVCFDSAATIGDITSNFPADKHKEASGFHFFLAGTEKFFDVFISCYLNGSRAEKWEDVEAFVATPEKIVHWAYFDKDGDVIPDVIHVGEEYAIGSGNKIAIGAMGAGASVKQAVEYAATRDIYTGGTIRVFDVENMEEVTE